jgi:hypothetical protein
MGILINGTWLMMSFGGYTVTTQGIIIIQETENPVVFKTLCHLAVGQNLLNLRVNPKIIGKRRFILLKYDTPGFDLSSLHSTG